MSHATIIVFPGSNCDSDCERALQICGFETKRVWHRETNLEKTDLIVLPGGFSFGDYLRPGAVAKTSPIMNDLVHHAARGVPIMGICNGFQILLEVGLLPGAMTKNQSLKFICKEQWVSVDDNALLRMNHKGLKLPIAHHDGNFQIDDDGLKSLQDNEQIVFRYSDKEGRVSVEDNPNGSVGNIAGLCSRDGRILGMMPHPERACDVELGSEDGKVIFEAMIEGLK